MTVLPNQPGFDWNKIRALPEVEALTGSRSCSASCCTCCPGASTDFPWSTQLGTDHRAADHVAGRLYDPDRADEIVVTPQFVAAYHKHLGDTLTLDLASVEQANRATTARAGRRPAPVAAAHRRGGPTPGAA